MRKLFQEKVSFSFWIRRRLAFGFFVFSAAFALSLASSFHSFWVYKNLENRSASLLSFVLSSPVPQNASHLDVLQSNLSPEWRSKVHDLQKAMTNKDISEATAIWTEIQSHLKNDLTPFQTSSRNNLLYFFAGTIFLGLLFWFWTWRTSMIVKKHLSQPVANLHENIKKFDGDLKTSNTSRFTDLEALSQELIQLHKRLIEEGKQEITSFKLATLSDMAMNLANEIRGPLQAIEELSQDILDDSEASKLEKVTKNSIRIQRQTELLSRMAESLLDFASLKDDKNRNSLNLKTLIEKSISILKPQLEERKVGIRIEVSESLQIKASQIQMEEVFYHLVSNAKDAVDKYSGQIQVRAQEGEKEVKIEVVDNGPGIPEDLVQKIWEPFYSTKSKRSGSGLGLSVVRQILATHGASIEYKRLGGETVFSIRFPNAEELQTSQAA